MGHFLELIGVVLVGVPVALDLRRGGASRPLVGDLSAAELVASEEAYLGARVRTLMLRLGEQDGSTEGHSRGVALLAVQVGEALNLPPATLRHLAVGGLLHDIGKLRFRRDPAQGRVAQRIEYEEVKRHPDAGERLLRELGGFSPEVLALVAAHHERLDGKGYPHNLGATPRARHADPRPSAMSTTRSSPTACIARPGRPSGRSSCCARTPGAPSTRRCVWALQRVLASTADDPGWVATFAPSAPVPAWRATR